MNYICGVTVYVLLDSPDSKVHGANMGPTWVLPAPDGPHVGPMNLATRVGTQFMLNIYLYFWQVQMILHETDGRTIALIQIM